MAEHYNAFISYKHAPEDNLVADAVHKGLERFHIPGKIRKKTGIKKINRIFRDKAELPITNDLSDNISYALANSDYLIVLCSTNTKESAWVPREIEAFLENHTKRDIFTVLVNGEPRDVIPEILQYEERIVTNENGVEEQVRIPVEPLSCDYRIAPKKAKKTELPRLASGLIGCAYDELMNRHRQYRLKQLTAVFSVALAVLLAFSGYMLYSRNKIHENYLESLRNQSRYLAKESTDLLAKERRITALKYALDALPKDDDDDRPVTPEAIRALTDATLAYEAYNGYNIHAAWNYEMPGIVSDFLVSDNGESLAVADKGSVVGVWNTKTHERTIYLEEMDSTVVGIGFLSDDRFAVWTYNTITCFDPASGEKVWDYKLEEDGFRNRLCLLLNGQTFFLGTNSNSFLEMDTNSGAVKNRIEIPLKSGFDLFDLVESKLSPNGKKIAFRGMVGKDSFQYGVWDIDRKQLTISPVQNDTVKDIEWLDDDTLTVDTKHVDSTSNRTYGSLDIISSDRYEIFCLGASDLKEKWHAEFISNGVSINSGFRLLKKDSVAYYAGNVIYVYDTANGHTRYQNNVNDSVIDVSDRDKDGTPTYITTNGGYAYPALNVDRDGVYYSRYFTDQMWRAVINDGVYVCQNDGSEVIYYGVRIYDDTWTPLGEDAGISGYPSDFCLDENCLVLLSSGTTEPVLDLFGQGDLNTHSQCRLEGTSSAKYQLLGIYDNRVFLGYNNTNTYDLVSVDLTGSDLKKDELFTMNSSFENACVMKGGKLVYCFTGENEKPSLAVYDIKTGEKQITELPEDIGMIRHAPVYYEEQNLVCIEGDFAYLLNTANKTPVKLSLPTGWAGATCFSESFAGTWEDGRLAVSDGKNILTVDSAGQITGSVNCPGVTPKGMIFIDDELIVFYNDGSLYRYSEDGQFLNKTEISSHDLSGQTADFEYDPEAHLLYIESGRTMDVVDTESGVGIAHIDDCFGHNKGRDLFITTSRDEGTGLKIGYFKRYTVEELIDKAKKLLTQP